MKRENKLMTVGPFPPTNDCLFRFRPTIFDWKLETSKKNPMHDSPDIFKFCSSNRDLFFSPALQQGFGPVQAQQNQWKNRFFAGFYFTDWIKYKEKTFCRFLDSKLGCPICCCFFHVNFITPIDIHRSWVPWSAASPQDWVPSCDHSNIFSTKILSPKIKK